MKQQKIFPNKTCMCCCRHFARELINVKNDMGFVGGTPILSIQTPEDVLHNYNINVYKFCKFTEYISIIFDYNSAKKIYDLCINCNCCNRHKSLFPSWAPKRERESDESGDDSNKKRRT